MHSNRILAAIGQAFESPSYSDRISGMSAFEEIIPLTKDEEAVNKVIGEVIKLVAGKYFKGKEEVMDIFASMLEEGLIDAPNDYVKMVVQ